MTNKLTITLVFISVLISTLHALILQKRYYVRAPRAAEITDYPSLVSLRLKDEHFCTATIVGKKHLVTSSTCVCSSDSPSKDDIEVITGVTSKLENRPKKPIKNVLCDTSPIAFIELENELQYDTLTQCKPLLSDDWDVSGKNCYLVGWNKQTTNGLEKIYGNFDKTDNCPLLIRNIYGESTDLVNEVQCLQKRRIWYPNFPGHFLLDYEWYGYGSPVFCDDQLMGIYHAEHLTNIRWWTITKLTNSYKNKIDSSC